MTLKVHLFPCLTDNYGFLVRDETSGAVASVDAPDGPAILTMLDRLGWGRLDMILNTHWHPDHTQGAAMMQAETSCQIVGPEESRRVIPLDRVVAGGEAVALGDTTFEVSHTPGHTLGHVVFRSIADRLAFVGDVIFPLGCGRLFEGTPDQMWSSLQTVAAWPHDTALFGAHEYAAGNARFALTLDSRPEMQAHAEAIFAQRERDQATVPTTVGIEAAFNPFLRAANVADFAARRLAKDQFSG